MSLNRKKKVTRITPLNSEEVAMSQPRISEFLSDNANKESTRPSALSSPDAEKTSNLSPQVEKVPLLKEPVSEAEGTAKVAWSVVKPNTTSTPPVELQNPSNSSDVACRSEVKRENYEKNRKRREKKRVMRGLAGMTLADYDLSPLTIPPAKLNEPGNLRILCPPEQTSRRSVGDMMSLMICKEAKPRKRWLAQAPQLAMLRL